MSYARQGETSPDLFSDHDWVRRNKQALLDRYEEHCIGVYHEAVIGVGNTYETAVEDAEQRLLAEIGDTTPIVELLRRRIIKQVGR